MNEILKMSYWDERNDFLKDYILVCVFIIGG